MTTNHNARLSPWWAGLLLASALFSACGVPAQAQTTEEEPPAPLEASGFIEAEEVSVVAEFGGRVAEVLVDEADIVQTGDPLVLLDDTLLQADRAQAVAALAVAEANLALVKAGPRSEELAAAQASLEQAIATLEGAQQAYNQALAMVANPQDVNIQITTAETQVALAEQALQLVKAQLQEELYMLDWLRSEDEDPTAIEFQDYTVQVLEAQVRAAQAQLDGAQHRLDVLQSHQQHPLVLIAQAHQAEHQVTLSEAQVDLAQAQVDLVGNGPREQEVAIVQAQVELAHAQIELIDAQIAQLTLVAPIGGVVTSRSIYAGETASPGVPLMTIANLETLKLVVYISETQIGRVRLNAPVDITVDAYPGRAFQGTVLFIAREAEFTPRNVQTEEERVNLVFAVEIRIENPGGELKPGMPADVVIETDD